MDMTAMQIMQDEYRLRARAVSAVSQAMDRIRRADPDEITMRDVYDVAMEAAIRAITSVISGDAELTATRIERDHYKKVALHGLDLSAMPSFVLETSRTPATTDAS